MTEPASPLQANALALLKELIAKPSVTPDDAGCQALLAQRLQALGFELEWLPAGPAEARVSNLWATRAAAQPDAPTLVFAGHTDVVPSGAESHWSSPPFKPTEREGRLYGRGASDMKGSIAAFVAALESVIQQQPRQALRLALLLTSDEEGPAVHGTTHVIETLRARGERLDYCIVGEPTAEKRTGDMIKSGRRGSLSGRLHVHGVQGHIAYPHLARNPIHQALPALAELAATEWDAGNEFFPPTSWQISNIHAGTGAGNVIPGELVVDFNFRFSTESSDAQLRQRVHAVLDRHGLDYTLHWTLGGQPFLTPSGTLVQLVQQAVGQVTGLSPELSTSGGTSDGRFIATLCPQVIELGPPNASIHKVDEHIALADLDTLTRIYAQLLELLHAQHAGGAGANTQAAA
ncbi:succinyl-diaminopimelate desuccinylase [Vandammella animalimorsus]|uniref:Succinyl-diaminopimelate desuccinylase n=1 Tax=Vandammella animalimorsus TaxID=2029117 RepID=A0A2A2T9K1_9BURK|nr:succinyl-diaminopimelate desuccinylase [Vandammella animalimorsus]PAT33281.1 succinyl-diaminopimelate desuccinylase [Vandammella animalimorsus]PAX18481.1 succinyl-diaminopimelate desuccinylase [Vandammella animalimorsus]PAX20645.1 succinyl-diaminopimelate desuccinylase [Vandammella animalimorsus]